MLIRIAKRLKFYREKAELTPELLSKLTDISVADILDYERGRRKPDIEIIKKYSHACDITMDELLLFQPELEREPLVPGGIQHL
ncbi:MAG: helix-turn-helix transcriptional regulator [Clostridia bacterium]|nr:helix-turn-helix transcriptional regulator [Clostridia bacterium]